MEIVENLFELDLLIFAIKTSVIFESTVVLTKQATDHKKIGRWVIRDTTHSVAITRKTLDSCSIYILSLTTREKAYALSTARSVKNYARQ